MCVPPRALARRRRGLNRPRAGTDTEEVVVKFAEAEVDSVEAATAYMNTLALSGGTC